MKKNAGVTLSVIAVFVTVLLVLSGNSWQSMKNFQSGMKSESKYYSYLDNIDMSKAIKRANEMCLAFDPKVPKSIESISTNVFIARVTSIDKADSPALNKEEIKGDIYPFTYGKMAVLTNIVGEIPSEETVFVRGGGVMMEKDIYKYDDPEDIEKMDEGRVAGGFPRVEDSEALIDERYENDIYLESGKVYLMYARWNEDWKKYEIIGFQYGSLELLDNDQSIDAMPESRSNPSGKMISKSWKVKNVSTGEEQNLDDYLKDGLGIDISSQ